MTTIRATSKPDGHGATLYLYRVRYTDDDGGCPTFSSTVWAYNRDDATDRWLEAAFAGDDGWRVVSCARVPRSHAPGNQA